MKPRNIKNTIAKGEELQHKRLVTIYQDELNQIIKLTEEQASAKVKETGEANYYKFYYEYYLTYNAVNFGASVGFNAGKRATKKK